MKAFSTSRAKKEAIRLGLPHEGNKNKKTTSLGYARKFTTLKNFFWDGFTTSTKYGFKKVYLSTWVDEPNPKSLPTDRKEIKETFDGIDQTNITYFLKQIIDAKRIFIAGVGRTGLVM